MGGSCGDMRRAARVAARAAILIWRHGQQAAVRVYLGPHTNKPRAAAHWLLFDGDRRGVSVGLTPINGSAPCVSRRHGPAGPRARHRIPRECPARLRGARQGRHGLPARLVRAETLGQHGTPRDAAQRRRRGHGRKDTGVKPPPLQRSTPLPWRSDTVSRCMLDRCVVEGSAPRTGQRCSAREGLAAEEEDGARRAAADAKLVCQIGDGKDGFAEEDVRTHVIRAALEE